MNVVGTAPSVKKILVDLPVEGSCDRILDIGCGTGLATEVLVKKHPDAHIVGLDYSKEMLCRYVKRFPDCEAVSGDFNDEATIKKYPGGQDHALESGSFDMVVSAGAISEYGDLRRILPAVKEWLSDGGSLVNIGVQDNIINRTTGKFWKFRPTSGNVFVTACKDAGFSYVETVFLDIKFFPSNILKFAVKAVK